ncbi:hypothetical protein, partial [Nocardia carnea]|uniref:hypothetical protein n=1 Tax=Nocardia carnea TaxID=37328 RepID=UPI002457C230
MNAITEAVTLGRSGDIATARARLLEIWTAIGVAGDALHRCTLAHYLADLYDDPAQALAWDIRALDAADSLGDDRARQYHASLQVAGFYPSLHLNLADNYRRLGSWGAPGGQHPPPPQHQNPRTGPTTFSQSGRNVRPWSCTA